MTTIFGREGELGRIDRILDSAQSNHLVRAVRVLGASGVGKTALATAASEGARDAGWIVASTQCFRIHNSLPLFVARRLTRSLIEALRDRAETYRSGLDLDSDKPERFEEAFYRLIEAVTLDFPVTMFIDDAQWADEASRQLIARALTALADRQIVLISTERSDESPEAAFALNDETIAVGELSNRAAEELVRSVFPEAQTDVVASVVSGAGGRAVDIVAVAEAARDAQASTSSAVNASTRTVIARDLAVLDNSMRTFLQICALIEEPIDFGLLRLIWSQDELLGFIGKASGRYLIEDGGELRFVHAAIMEAVHETIPIEIPYRYRIIEALKKLSMPRLEDYERLAQQASAVRDSALERETLQKLAREASAKSFHALAADAMERALRIAPPSPEELVPFYTQLSMLYNTTGRDADCIRVCREGLAAVKETGQTEGLGQLVASLILALWHSGEYESARSEFGKYHALLTSAADRAQVVSAGSYIEMHAGRFEELAQRSREFNLLSSSALPFVQLRQNVAEAFAAFRLGDERCGLELTAGAERLAQSLPPLAMTMPRNLRMMHAAYFLGIPATEQILPSRGDETNSILGDVLLALILLSRGQFSDLRTHVGEKLLQSRGTLPTRHFLGFYAASLGFDAESSNNALSARVAEEVADFHSGSRAAPLLPIVAGWLAAAGPSVGARSEFILNEIINAHAQPIDSGVFAFPVLLTIAAKKLNAQSQLLRLSDPATLWSDRNPFAESQKLLARGAALAALRHASAPQTLVRAREAFESLGMPFFARYAASLTETAAIVTQPSATNKTTRREREVAALVADGLSNREIAERLVLSERTVEGHIANLFAKVNVGSRTQLAAWFLKNASSAAS